ncbi:TetR family transcriptional regulator [Pandoraea sp. ISTKB]|uniref:TetR family transcriptional regulator n=1 Tax=Pandoraea sp. ISTKB TaxID=1586708 RepID=UPI00352E3475
MRRNAFPLYSHCARVANVTMNSRRKPQISLRKQPKQARSSELVAAILEAAIQVLAKEGAQRFTTARVAERAGVSVGSVYQYFPNKAAILFRLQSDEWQQTTTLLSDILEDVRTPPFERLHRLIHAFIQSECDESEMRVALGDSAPLYRDAPEMQETKASGARIFQTFIDEVLPDTPQATRDLAGDLIVTTMATVGKQFSETPRTPSEIKAYAGAMADMFCAYLRSIEKPLLAR